MIKTQIQLPDHLYRDAKRITQEYEMSLAELIRRSLELALPGYPPRAPEPQWTLPLVDMPLIVDPFANEDWRENLHLESMVAEDKGNP
ncbi:MAG TPA: hypothetical protein PKX94_10790 [Opitutales bacterium]|nr:hypothetical protein [Opitutales bacterium]